ncbi:MAG TPA: A/G-specific adenine glycosylase [Candidatus Limnocylindria bacterium]|nr:A/G-specific adenine glycosylase [Candidatus Limnocylindria bacterium]
MQSPATDTQPSPAGELQAAVLDWYRAEGRVLDFRSSRDPYAILVSETMAQQTQIARVVDYWSAFLTRFPTFEALAAATPADVLRAWQGLGYDRRALNLLRCARIVVTEVGGHLPSEVDELERLPGIGPYTARAIAALAFGRPVGAVDVNVHRVLSRVVSGTEAGSMTRAAVQAVADAVVPADRPREWTHALMDVGATFCRPRQPRCEACPAKPWCLYAASAEVLDAPRGMRRGGRRRAASRPVPFSSTTRWLRGRILDRLRTVEDDGWTWFRDGIGSHGRPAVEAALVALAQEGLIELRHGEGPSARLATA